MADFTYDTAEKVGVLTGAVEAHEENMNDFAQELHDQRLRLDTMQCGISMMRYVSHNGKAPTTALTIAVLQQQLQ
eukprot:10922933-Heterocapsa_arctica.AAC.1